MNTLKPTPQDNQGFITPEACAKLWKFSRDEIDQFADAIVGRRAESRLRADGTFSFDFANKVAEKIIAKRK
ncbi:hypothetical protein CWE17_08730 [Synechococcus sp. BS56D]|uniref:hypothetical protein n=1 Tax=Synechococcus sp. BS56D TaxID=2055944 RepID=UPI00103E771F|nr:hypothetical protein [Synechococcus sp. BS56D]TCD56740.1 hypothetical protein CWE17_08730 [Synechococcus sp. BS56D]